MFQISGPRTGTVYVSSVEQIGPAARSNPPGRYEIHKIGGNQLACKEMPCQWGVAIKRLDGSVEVVRGAGAWW
jgi:hypothetical protein